MIFFGAFSLLPFLIEYPFVLTQIKATHDCSLSPQDTHISIPDKEKVAQHSVLDHYCNPERFIIILLSNTA